MKSKLMAGALAGATLATGSVIPVLNNINSTNNINVKSSNEVLLSQPVSNTSGQEAVVVNGDNNLVLFNNADSQSVNSYLSTGEMLTITGHEGNFYKVTVHETGAVGYISTNNAQIIESGINSTFNKNITDGSIINVSTSVHLRSQPDLNSGILKNLKNNTNIEVLGTQGQWVKVNVNGTIGYIYESYVSIENTTSASATANSSSTATTNSINNSTSNNVNSNVNKDTNVNTNNTTSEKVNTSTSNAVSSSSSSSSATSSNTNADINTSDKTTSNSTNNDQSHNQTITNTETSNSESNINISLNDSAYIKAAPKVDFHDGTSLENSSKTTEFNNKQIDNVTVLNKQNNYYEVKLADGTVGLVNQNYIVFSGNAQKSEYLNKLNDLSIKTYNIFDTETAQSSQTNMNIYSGQCAEMWEHQLKDMSNSLMKNLPQNKIDQFKQSEEQFKANVDSAIKQVAKAYEGGSIVPLMENMYYQDLTEQRCFNLVNEYPEVYNSTAIQNSQETTTNKNNDSNTDKTATATNNSQKENTTNSANSKETNTTNNTDLKETTATNNSNAKDTKTTTTNTDNSNKGTISSRTKSSPATNNQNTNKEKYINSDKIANESHNENNSTSNVINVKTGAGYSKINEEASNHAVSSNTLDNLVYTHINDSFAPCRNYVSYNEISNVINNGTQAQKEALIQKYGSTCLVVNLGTSNQSVTPELYYNGQFYYKFTCTNLYSLINNPNNKFTGVINANGQAPGTDAYNNAVNNQEVFSLGSSQPTWASSQINC